MLFQQQDMEQRTPGARSAPPFYLIVGVSDFPVDGTKCVYSNLYYQAAIVIDFQVVGTIHKPDAIVAEVSDIDGIWLGNTPCGIFEGASSFSEQWKRTGAPGSGRKVREHSPET